MTTPIFVLAICLSAISAQAHYSGGSGTADDPYQIATAADLIALGETPDDYDKHFILTADIDLDPNLPGRKVFDRAVIDSFKGVFDGNGHSALNLRLTGGAQGYAAMFARVQGPRAEIKDLHLIDANVDVGEVSHVGSLVGYLAEGSVDNCYVEGGTVTGDSIVGGLVGMNGRGDITGSHSTSAVSGEQQVGGLVGSNSVHGTITASYSSGIVSGTRSVGGLAGGNAGAIAGSYSAGSVTGNEDVGGLVGSNSTSITASYSTSTVSGTQQVGGLVGTNWVYGNITTSYSASRVSGPRSVGGLVGGNVGVITASYSAGAVAGYERVGGLVGTDRNEVGAGSATASFWDVETSEQLGSAGGTGLTSAKMQTAAMFLDAGWDFVDETENGPNDVWKIVEGQTYPLLSWQKYGGGTGEPNDPYLIYTAEHLNALGAEPNDYDKHFKLMADIDLGSFTGTDFNVIGYHTDWDEKPFTGVFDGSGHVISHFTYDSSDARCVGVFGYVDHDQAVIKNLGLIDPTVTGGTGRGTGSLVGFLSLGTISDCYVEGGTVSGEGPVGGLAGQSLWGTVIDCRSSASITGDDPVGGLVGRNYGGRIMRSRSTGSVVGTQSVGGPVGSNMMYAEIVNCYAAGQVAGDRNVGGVAGHNSCRMGSFGDIRYCYSIGQVTGSEYVGGIVGWNCGTVELSFWDTERSGLTGSEYGRALTTAEMQTASTFLDAGWDFIDETKNGTDDIWLIDEGQDYPRLWWEQHEAGS